MKDKPQEFTKRWVGCVEINTGNHAAKLTSIQTDKEGKVRKFPNNSLSINVNLSDFPKLAQRVIKPNMTNPKQFRVRLSEDGDEVETVTPFFGTYKAHAVGLGPKRENGEFKLIPKVFNEGTKEENRHDEFICIYEITEGVYRGVELPGYYLHYKFEEDPENEGFTRFNTTNSSRAVQLHKLISWAEVHGDILEDDVRWHSEDEGTILEELENRVLENDREVNLVFEKGYIKLVQPVEEYEEEVEESDEDELPEFLQEPEEKKPAKEEVKPVKGVGKKAPAKKVKAAVVEDDDL